MKLNWKRFLIAQSVVCVVVLLLGVLIGWSMNNRVNQPREQLEQKLADTRIILNDALQKLSVARSDRDFYKRQVDDGTIPSRLVKVVYNWNPHRDPAKAAFNPGPDSEWENYELARDYPDENGTIVVNYIPGEIGTWSAKHDQAIMGYVVDTFGSTEQSGPGH